MNMADSMTFWLARELVEIMLAAAVVAVLIVGCMAWALVDLVKERFLKNNKRKERGE